MSLDKSLKIKNKDFAYFSKTHNYLFKGEKLTPVTAFIKSKCTMNQDYFIQKTFSLTEKDLLRLDMIEKIKEKREEWDKKGEEAAQKGNNIHSHIKKVAKNMNKYKNDPIHDYISNKKCDKMWVETRIYDENVKFTNGSGLAGCFDFLYKKGDT